MPPLGAASRPGLRATFGPYSVTQVHQSFTVSHILKKRFVYFRLFVWFCLISKNGRDAPKTYLDHFLTLHKFISWEGALNGYWNMKQTPAASYLIPDPLSSSTSLFLKLLLLSQLLLSLSSSPKRSCGSRRASEGRGLRSESCSTWEATRTEEHVWLFTLSSRPRNRKRLASLRYRQRFHRTSFTALKSLSWWISACPQVVHPCSFPQDPCST